MTQRVPITPSGLQTLRDELRNIKENLRPQNVADIETALGHGDLRENAEYHAAKERQAELAARQAYLESRISLAQVIDPEETSSDRVAFGATVTLADADTEEEVVYRLVGEDESDVKAGKISISAPIARALLGKEEGDDVTVHLPKGDREFEILKVEYMRIP
ncbi:transcription elongation factor GreA [Pseudenhygromyxa sp. WMMC2535]|uniref:transcription elongation factor GreA n=1 Tax=Pseudenhygromyxa sp. WMMC2535 TaxID=2712867 RepID=UPI0015563875|nr:transcription elongation factor GreA [Pseudenhygromyxa sp. WMMC2535]NVB39933.1 transcription elongation factor GreA [Pseudenhygromyxa sp. WMMC2535]